MSSQVSGGVGGSPPGSGMTQAAHEGLDNAGRLVDQHIKEDQRYTELSGQLRIPSHRELKVVYVPVNYLVQYE